LVIEIRFNLKATIEREKAVQAIAGHKEWKNCVVTFWVLSQFSHLQGVVQTFVIQLLFLGLRLMSTSTFCINVLRSSFTAVGDVEAH
jgi:hypothetical protein